MIIGGAEDKLRKRAILRDFVSRSGGADARIAVIPTASSIGGEVMGVYDALFRTLGAADVLHVSPEITRGGALPRARRAPGGRHRHLHDRRQPAQALRGRQRHPGR